MCINSSLRISYIGCAPYLCIGEVYYAKKSIGRFIAIFRYFQRMSLCQKQLAELLVCSRFVESLL